MHITGLFGMPRRVYTYSSEMGWDALNMISTLGSFLFALGILLMIIDATRTLRRPTKPTYGSRQRRLEGKSQRSETKALRGKVRD